MQPTKTDEPDDFDVDCQKIVLSKRDFAHFVELIENPPAPTQALQDAMADYDSLKAMYPDANM